MPITFQIDSDAGVIHARFEGDIGIATLIDYNKRLRRDPAFRTGLVELVEIEKIRPQAGFPELIVYAKWSKGFETIRRTAIVARNDMAYGMARMYQQIFEGGHTEIQVFRDLESARVWLLGTE